ncbi:hypothetical protein BU24DRAFT_427104 [Aaosphaeria arxii CBS 175.79]|uniref:Cora-domain-containing protein n=1 Tax=Aaosphaeria arxii CBS 175.79 TaxID=1450172 RepID=A0A6A5XCS7_9PLEO|nr:uncharacterized protein BU24DRAFT_427104 [Aaosphaeria arxii CBS 175.79]KAF2010915.1 hypothetical protein BU24DRAFT_427104 [Aaosphaeria arxii CBS 175.79]
MSVHSIYSSDGDGASPTRSAPSPDPLVAGSETTATPLAPVSLTAGLSLASRPPPLYSSTPKQLDASSYIKRICDHATTSARDSLYQGQDWSDLAKWLSSRPTSYMSPKSTPSFAWLYMLDGKVEESAHIAGHELALPLKDSLGVSGPDTNVLVFLRGYPSPEWVSQIGARFRIDPEVFYRHLSFFHHHQALLRQSPFVLPSSQTSIFHLTLTTVGHYDAPVGESVSKIRSTAARGMGKYLSSLKGSHWKTGNSIVRAFDVHSESIFSLEQLVTVYVSQEKSDGRWTALIWLDSGDDLLQSPPGPWVHLGLHQGASIFPVTMFKRMISLKGAKHRLFPSGSPVHSDKGRPQSVSLLPLCYGRSLNAKRMSEDSLYALHELFQFWGTSEVQFLNVVASGLDALDIEPGKYVSTMLEVQHTLDFYKDILNRHANSTMDVLQLIETRDILDWPRSSANKPELMAEQLHRDIRYILDRTHALQEQCKMSMTALTNQASLQEARNAILQGQRVYRLTLLAFIFIPLSFCTSIFGMNFVTFDQSRKGIYTFFSVTAPVLLLSLAMFNLDRGTVWKFLSGASLGKKRRLRKTYAAVAGSP